MTKTQKRVLLVLNRITKQVEVSHDDAAVYSLSLNDMLECLASEDFFGTEGQNDPRGDQRYAQFSMERVAGIDV